MGDPSFRSRSRTRRQCADFLAEEGLDEQRGQRVVFARILPATRRGHDLAQAPKDVAAEIGLEHQSVADGQNVAGNAEQHLRACPQRKLARGNARQPDDALAGRRVVDLVGFAGKAFRSCQGTRAPLRNGEKLAIVGPASIRPTRQSGW